VRRSVAKSLGRTADYNFFLQHSLNYKHLFNPKTGFMQARNSDGSWASPAAGWTEGGPWVYTWDVLHDIPGLIQLLGGKDKYNARLDSYFAGDYNRHSNEPSHQVGYLYDFGGQPWKTQQKVREIADDKYANQPSGLDADDDCGQMSAWYIFTALGFYPVNPASGDYMIGSPLSLAPPCGSAVAAGSPSSPTTTPRPTCTSNQPLSTASHSPLPSSDTATS
jgi:predicted alpha-1,2-mannosidase